MAKEDALKVGLDHSTGAAVVPIDADLQEPPEIIRDMLEKWREGFDVVLAVRTRRETDSWLKRRTAFCSVMKKLARIHFSAEAGEFRLDRRVVDEIVRLREHNRLMKGILHGSGSDTRS